MRLFELLLRKPDDETGAAEAPVEEAAAPNVEEASVENLPSQPAGEFSTESEEFEMPVDSWFDAEQESRKVEEAREQSAPVAEAAPEAPQPKEPQATESGQQTQTQKPAKEPVQEAQPEPQPGPQSAEQPAAEPQDFLGALEQNRQAVEQELAQRFQLSEDDIAEFETSAEVAIPKLAGRILYEAISSVHKQIASFTPQIVQQTVQASETQRNAESQFYDKWPALRGLDQSQSETLHRISSAYVQANPQLPLATRIEHIGMMAHQALGIPLPQAAPAPQPAPQRRPQPSFTPAVSALPGTASPNEAESDPWAGFTLPGYD